MAEPTSAGPTPILPNSSIAQYGNLFGVPNNSFAFTNNPSGTISSLSNEVTNPTNAGNNTTVNLGNIIPPNWSTQSNISGNPTTSSGSQNIIVNSNSSSGTGGLTVATPTQSISQQYYQEVVNNSTLPSNSTSTNTNGTTSSGSTTPITSVTSATPISNGASNNSISGLLSSTVQPNPLNTLYQPSYHFRLFAAPDSDILTQAGNNPSSISGKQVPQVTIAETGVTGFNIKEVEIVTVGPTNSQSREMPATTIRIEITEPLGLSFLDALVGAASLLSIKNLNKSPYYLELTFTGYNADGTYAGRPVNVLRNFPNGGVWIWSVYITNLETKLNEGVATYTLDCVVTSTEPLSQDNGYLNVPSNITAYGSTVGDVFQDFIQKLNNAWLDHFGGTIANQLVIFNPIQTHPIPFGSPTAMGKDPKNFKLLPQAPYQASQRTDNISNLGSKSVQVPANTSVPEFIRSVILNTEEGQAIQKDEPSTTNIDTNSTQTNALGFKQSIYFAVEVDPLVPAQQQYDTNHGNYRKIITLHVVPHITQEPVLSSIQVANAQSRQTQIIQALVQNGFVKKRYDYIFTGLNTEVIDVDLSWNMSWNAVLPNLDGTRMGYITEGLQTLLSNTSFPITPDGTKKQAEVPGGLSINLSSANSIINATATTPGVTGVNPTSANNINLNTTTVPLTFTPTTGITDLTTAGPNSNSVALSTVQTLNALQSPDKDVVAMASTAQANTNSSTPLSFGNQPKLNATPSPTNQVNNSNGSNVYIEDVLNSVNQNTPINSNVIPLSFWYYFYKTRQEYGTGVTGTQNRGQTVASAVFEQVWGTPLNNDGKFQSVVLTIRGDPYWLGQATIDRLNTLRKSTGQSVYNPQGLPDWVSGDQAIQLYFKYPVQIGDNFQPTLNNSNTFNGLYFVNSAKHVFSDGAFRQELTCVRHYLVNSLTAPPSNSTTSTVSGTNNSSTIPSSATTQQLSAFNPAISG